MASKPKQPQVQHPQSDAKAVTPVVAQDPRVKYMAGADRNQVLNINPNAVAVVVYPNGIVTEQM